MVRCIDGRDTNIGKRVCKLTPVSEVIELPGHLTLHNKVTTLLFTQNTTDTTQLHVTLYGTVKSTPGTAQQCGNLLILRSTLLPHLVSFLFRHQFFYHFPVTICVFSLTSNFKCDP